MREIPGEPPQGGVTLAGAVPPDQNVHWPPLFLRRRLSKMGDSMPVWKGLFEWSMAFQGDGTGSARDRRAMSEEDRRWLEEALKTYMVDLSQRMKEIKEGLDGSQTRPTTLEEKEMLLEELMELVEGIDQAKDLHTIGGLPTLLDLLESEHSSLRWRAAEVVATCVQNNPPVQKWFMDGGALPRLMALLHDSDITCETKGLLALSCLIRGYHPALLAFREAGGMGVLCNLMQRDECPRLQRKCLQLQQYMVRTIPADRLAVVRAGVVGSLRALLASDDNDLRQAALTLASELGGDEQALRLMQEDSAFCDAVRELQMRLDTLPQEDWDSIQEEVAALKHLTRMLGRELPPAARGSIDHGPGGANGGVDAAMGGPAPRTVLVDNPETTGASPSQLQLAMVGSAAVPEGQTQPQEPQQLQ